MRGVEQKMLMRQLCFYLKIGHAFPSKETLTEKFQAKNRAFRTALRMFSGKITKFTAMQDTIDWDTVSDLNRTD